MWEGDAAQALFAGAPEVPSSSPTTCPYHPTLFSRSALVDVLSVLEVAEHSVLFFAGMVHQLNVTKEGTVDEGEVINFAISGVLPPPRQAHQLWHLGDSAQPGEAATARTPGPWSSCCPCDCKVCPLCNCAWFLTFPANPQMFV